ncbi:hypothetical protein C8034_v011604 [Colletotrichum sidae]|uniref:Uncharacterized protein n=1 Tax=Colletotrichum sidae TaxID=1347389 RepID=A0A4R8TIC7_9PEZI|nr:hypothetical protein C8034_v011604 [Colletotrichum sidae]
MSSPKPSRNDKKQSPIDHPVGDKQPTVVTQSQTSRQNYLGAVSSHLVTPEHDKKTPTAVLRSTTEAPPPHVKPSDVRPQRSKCSPLRPDPTVEAPGSPSSQEPPKVPDPCRQKARLDERISRPASLERRAGARHVMKTQVGM